MYPKAKRKVCTKCKKSLPMNAFTTYFRKREQIWFTEHYCRMCKYGYVEDAHMWLDDSDLGPEWQAKKEEAFERMIERGIFKK